MVHTAFIGGKAIRPLTILETPDDIPEDLDIPEEVETTVSLLLEYLQDKVLLFLRRKH